MQELVRVLVDILVIAEEKTRSKAHARLGPAERRDQPPVAAAARGQSGAELSGHVESEDRLQGGVRVAGVPDVPQPKEMSQTGP